MRFHELRDHLTVLGCSRKHATLGIRWLRGLEDRDSLFVPWEDHRENGNSHMSQKVHTSFELRLIMEARDLAHSIDGHTR